MKIGVIKIYPVRVPLRLRSATPKHSPVSFTNIIIEISDAKNRFRGYGEGCLPPQKQIFLEDWIKAAAAFLALNSFPWNLSSIYEIRSYIESLPPLPSLNPVVCAIETALLDILGRKQDKPLSAYFPSHHYTACINYTAKIPSGLSNRQTVAFCRAANNLGIRQVRLGVGADPKKTLKRLEAIMSIFNSRCTISLDPGLAWNPEITQAHMPLLERFPIWAIEDLMPLGKNGLAQVAGTLKPMGIKLIAGQSALTIEDAQQIVSKGLYDALSIQLSRNGGFHRSLKLVDYLRQNAFDYQISCHTAGSCILSSAGHIFNLLCRDVVNRDVVYAKSVKGFETVTGVNWLRSGGTALPMRGTGLGENVNRENIVRLKLNRFNGKTTTLTIKPVQAPAPVA